MYTPTEWIKKMIGFCINGFSTSEEERVQQFAELETVFNQYGASEKQTIYWFIANKLDPDDGLYVLSYIVGYTQIKDFWEIIRDNILKWRFDCFTQSMLEIQYMMDGRGDYRQKRTIHEKSVLCLREELKCTLRYQPVEERHRRRIVIMTEQMLLGTNHAPTKVVLEFSYVLQKQLGYEVMVILCPSNRVLLGTIWKNTKICRGTEDRMMKVLYKDIEIDVRQFAMKDCGAEEYNNMFQMIYEYRPLFVWNVGVMNPVADLAHDFTSVAVMELTTDCPVSEAEFIIRYEKKDDLSETEYEREMKPWQKQIFLKQKLPAVMEKTGRQYTRAEIGLPEERFLIAVVGNRLDEELNETFAGVMRGIIERQETTEFVMIGRVEKARRLFSDIVFEGRIHYLGYCPDLLGIYKTLDLYLNPKRLGGGFSGAIAVTAGLPVVTLPDCDVAYNVGEEFVVENYEKMIETAVRYSTDRAFYEKKQEAAKVSAEKNSDEKMTEYVRALVEKISGEIDRQELI